MKPTEFDRALRDALPIMANAVRDCLPGLRREDIEDVVQDTLATLASKARLTPDTFTDAHHVGAYLAAWTRMRCKAKTRDLAVNGLRHRDFCAATFTLYGTRKKALTHDKLEVTQHDKDVLLEPDATDDRHDRMERALHCLDSHDREFILAYYQTKAPNMRSRYRLNGRQLAERLARILAELRHLAADERRLRARMRSPACIGSRLIGGF